MKPGTRVRMTEELKKRLRGRCGELGHHVDEVDDAESDGTYCFACSSAHVDEFGDCEGVVEDLVQPNCPEVNVRWQPSNLRYGYDPKYLERV